MALPLTDRDKFLLLAALGLPESADRVIALLNLAGTGNMTGPGVATDNAIVRFDGTTGALVQNSLTTVSDAGALLAPNGTGGAPSYSFSGDSDTGVTLASANTLALVSGGATGLTVESAGTVVSRAQLIVPVASAAAPSVTFLGDLDTGLYSSNTNQIGLAAGGALRASIQTAGIVAETGSSIFLQDGSLANPGLTFLNDQNTGIYRVSADKVAVSTGGVGALVVGPTAVQIGAGTDTTSIHSVHGALQASAAGVLTLTNGPGASTGNPAVYLTLNINGTNYVIPAWAF